jgi:uncharacterized protein with HEPN domain
MLIGDMHQAARRAVLYAQDKTLDDYTRDLLVQSAVERQVQIVGEAACQGSGTLRSRQPHIPWKQIQAQRHILVHDYAYIDPVLMWSLVTLHLPRLLADLEALGAVADIEN